MQHAQQGRGYTTLLDATQHRAHGYLGGQDYAYNYGVAMYAPAAGTLGSGSGGESTFTLDQTVTRIVPAEAGESGNIMAALHFMHQSAYGIPGHYNAGAGPIGYVGNTGVPAAHWHVHGLSTTGGRVDWRKFVYGSGPIINPIQQGADMLGALVYQCQPDAGQPATGLSGAWFLMSAVSIVNVTASLGAFLATRLNCDTIAQAQASGGQPITMSQQGLDYIAAGIGAPDQILETLYTSSSNKIWRAA